jgi:cytochrome c-type protein NapB
MRRALVLSIVAGALALAGALAGDEPGKETPDPQAIAAPGQVKALSDADLSLYPGSLFAVPDPAGFTWNDDDPGGNDLLPRAFPLAPPRIPHGVTDFVPLTPKANACLDCHALGAGADAPELPPSHRTDLRHSPDKVEATVAGARYLCLACHVPTSDAKAARTRPLPKP